MARLEGYEPGEDDDDDIPEVNNGGVSNGSLDKDGTQSHGQGGASLHQGGTDSTPGTREDVTQPLGEVTSGPVGHVAHPQCRKVCPTVLGDPCHSDVAPTLTTDAAEVFKTAPSSNTAGLAVEGAAARPPQSGALKSKDDTLSPTIPVKYAIEQLREGRDHAAIRRELAQISSERVCQDDVTGRVHRKRTLHSTPFCASKRQCSSVPLVVSNPQQLQPDPWLNGILRPPILGQKVPSNSWFSRLFKK